PAFKAEDVAKLQPKARSLALNDGFAHQLVREAMGDDLHARRRALDLIRRDQSRFTNELLSGAIAPNLKSPDPALRRGAARLLRAVPEKERAAVTGELRSLRETAAAGLASPNWEVSKPAYEAARRRGQLLSCLDCVRVLQLKLGDVGSASARGTVWEG